MISRQRILAYLIPNADVERSERFHGFQAAESYQCVHTI